MAKVLDYLIKIAEMSNREGVARLLEGSRFITSEGVSYSIVLVQKSSKGVTVGMGNFSDNTRPHSLLLREYFEKHHEDTKI